MPRLLALALAALTVGCGGAVDNLLATVPPPVELTAGTTGLIQLPPSGTYRGELVIQRVSVVSDGNGVWTEASVETISTGRSAAVIRDSRIELTQDTVEAPRFTGRLYALPATASQPGTTYADLTAFDGNRERFPYVLVAGEPNSFRLTARTNIERSGDTYRFDRYRFTLSP